MTLCIIAKLAGSLGGLAVFAAYPASVYAPAAAIGILPVWLEVAASRFTRVEPSRETRRGLLRADAVVDATVFLLVPGAWLWHAVGPVAGVAIPAALLVFVGAGLFRLGRFLRRGLRNGRYFEGVPVTYMGYLWLPLIALIRHGAVLTAAALLLVAAFCMVCPWIRIPTPELS